MTLQPSEPREWRPLSSHLDPSRVSYAIVTQFEDGKWMPTVEKKAEEEKRKSLRVVSPENNQLSLKWDSQWSGSKWIEKKWSGGDWIRGAPPPTTADPWPTEQSWAAEDDFRRRLNDLWSYDSAAEINRRLSDLTRLVSHLKTERPSVHRQKNEIICNLVWVHFKVTHYRLGLNNVLIIHSNIWYKVVCKTIELIIINLTVQYLIRAQLKLPLVTILNL